jgi:hypothetical protein
MTETIKNIRKYSEHIKALFALAGILFAGALLGVAVASAYYRENLQREREVTRVMFVDLAAKMDAISKRVETTTTTQADAANKLQDATTTVNEVVDKVDLAAAKADKAAKAAIVQAAKVAKVLPPTPQAPAVQSDVVNREIRKANEKLKERTK